MTALGFRAHRGGAVVVGVALEEGAPRLVLSTNLATGVEGDRLTWEPYHAAAGADGATRALPPPNAAAIVAAGCAAQVEIATRNVGDLLMRLTEENCAPTRAAVLINRVPREWIDDLRYVFAFDEHVRIAETFAVRDAIRAALKAHGVPHVDVDEKSLMEVAPERLGAPENAIAEQLAAFGRVAGRPWRKEHRQAALAAWMAAWG